jgi:hypothetical protein
LISHSFVSVCYGYLFSGLDPHSSAFWQLFRCGHPEFPGVKFLPFQGSDKKFLHMTTGVCGGHCITCKQPLQEMGDFKFQVLDEQLRNYDDQVKEAQQYQEALQTAIDKLVQRAQSQYLDGARQFSAEQMDWLFRDRAEQTLALKTLRATVGQTSMPLIPGAGSESCGTDDLHNNTAFYRMFSGRVRKLSQEKGTLVTVATVVTLTVVPVATVVTLTVVTVATVVTLTVVTVDSGDSGTVVIVGQCGNSGDDSASCDTPTVTTVITTVASGGSGHCPWNPFLRMKTVGTTVL